MSKEKERHPWLVSDDDEYIGNIWGWRKSMIALAIIMLFLSIAVCRYIVVQPDRLIIPEQVEDF